MKIIFLGEQFSGRMGILEGSAATDKIALLPEGAELDHLVGGSQIALTGEQIDLSTATLRAPIVPEARILCVGLNFRTHAEEAGIPVPDKPSLFARFRSSLVDPEEKIVLPRVTSAFDFEGEIAVVIGKGGRHIAEEDVFDSILGYTCLADNSLRDWQNHSRQITPGKNFDASGSIGPWIVTRDEIADIGVVEIETFVNGERRQHGFGNDLIFSIPYVVSYVSQFMHLRCGDIIAMGTPAGSAAGEKNPNWLKAGDRVDIRISGIGSLKNEVTTETAVGEAR